MANRTVAVELVARVQSYKASLQTAAQSTREFGGELDKMRKDSKHNFDQMALGVGAAGAALMGLVGWATKVGMEFDKQMSEVSAVTNASADDMGKLRQAALDAGQATVFSATDAAKAEGELAKAGLSTSDILGGALKGALSLAAAGSLDLAQAAEIAAKTMGQFELKGKDVGHIADLLAGAANASATDVHDLGEALKMGGGAAHSAGMSLEDTTTVLTAFAKKALTGSDAGTSLKTMLMMLQAPTNKAQGVMDQYGFSVYDATGKMVDAYTLTQKLKDSFGSLTQEERNAAFATIFGADAMRAANSLYSLGSDGLHKLNAEMLAQADAARVAAQKTDNLAGDLERLKGSLESAMITAQAGSTGPLRWLVETLDHMVGTFSGLPTAVQGSIFMLAGLTGGALLGVVAFMKFRNALGDALDSMREAGPNSAKVAGGLENVAKWAGRASLALAGMQVTGLILSAVFEKDLHPQIKALQSDLLLFADSGRLGGEALRIMGDDTGALGRALSDATLTGFNGFLGGLSKTALGAMQLKGPIGESEEKIKALDTALAGMASGGHADAAAAAFKRIWEEAQKQGIEVDALRAAFPEYVAAASEAAKATREAGAAAGGAALSTEAQATQARLAEEENRKLAGAFGVAATAVDGLTNKFKELNGAELDWRGAERNAEQAVDDLTQKLKESNGSLNVHNEKGRAAAAAVDALAEAAVKAAQKKYEETGSVTEASKTYDLYIGQLRNALLAAKLAKPEVDKLIASIASMPPTKNIDINVTTWYRENVIPNQAAKNLKRLDRIANRWGGAYTHAADGALRDAGIYSAQSPARYAFAEPETGGEAFIPRRGDAARSMGILQTAAGWYGAQVVPQRQQSAYTGGGAGMGGGGGTTQIELTVRPAPGADQRVMAAITEGLRFDIDTKGAGNPQTYLTRRR